MNLEELRQEINQIDDDLVVLLEKRMKLVNQVATYKAGDRQGSAGHEEGRSHFRPVADHVENPATKIRFLLPLRIS